MDSIYIPNSEIYLIYIFEINVLLFCKIRRNSQFEITMHTQFSAFANNESDWNRFAAENVLHILRVGHLTK